jgi:hypothetical protein
MRLFWVFIIFMFTGTSEATSADLVRGMLHADGILTVEGADASEALITVMPADAPTYSLDRGTTRFVLELELNTKYMVRFERTGCITKDLYFDTSVPAEYLLDHYTFPFQVVLESDPRAEIKSYAGPVGYIQYLEPVNDFDYVTDYELVIDKRIKEKIDVMQGTTAAPPATVTGVGNHPELNSMDLAGDGSSAPVERLRDEPAAGPIRLNPVAPSSLNNSTDVPVDILRDGPSAIVDPEPAPDSANVPETAPAISPPGSSSGVERLVPPDPSRQGRTEELIVEDNMVVTIVRITNEQGFQHEYRRIAHKFGPVFYFMDDQSIPEHMYRDHTGL